MAQYRDSFTERIVAAVMVGDNNTASQITGEAMSKTAECLIRMVEQHPKSDLPFWLASMHILSESMLNVLPESGKRMYENLIKLTSAVVIEKKSFMQQLNEEEEE